jgi:CheY-like chemotaxis protein
MLNPRKERTVMGRRKVLLVDDVHLIIELEKAFLRGLPVEVLVARNGEEALEIVHRERPDLIYLDLNMPVMDGPACCARLKADPRTRAIPVIMVTTAGREEDERLCRESGCDDFITKPINRRDFLEKGRKCIADFERRRRRFSYAGAIEFLRGGEPSSGQITDISTGGLFIAVHPEQMPDEPVDLSFLLPLPDRSVVVAARGRIAWRNAPHELRKPTYPSGFGIEFIDIDPKTVEMIEHYFFKLFNDTES